MGAADVAAEIIDPLDLTGSRGSAKAAREAMAAKMRAYQSLQGVDSSRMDQIALEQAKKNYLDQMAFAKQYSPGAYSAYQNADAALGAAFSDAAGDIHRIREAAKAAYDEGIRMQPGLSESERLAAEQSAEMLALKGSLSPEQQAELVRAGLATSAAGGGVLGSSANRSGMARQLASDQLNIQHQRQSMASNLAGMSQGIRTNRQNQLAGLQGMQTAAASAGAGMAGMANQAFYDRLPAGYGIGGDTAAANYVSNINLENQKKLGAAGAQVEGINAQYQAARKFVRTSATAAGAAIGGAFGGPSGASAGAGFGSSITAG